MMLVVYSRIGSNDQSVTLTKVGIVTSAAVFIRHRQGMLFTVCPHVHAVANTLVALGNPQRDPFRVFFPTDLGPNPLPE